MTAIIFVAVISVIIAVTAQHQNDKSYGTWVPAIRLEGEYRVADGKWQPISSAEHISATNGTVELKGVWVFYDRASGEKMSDMAHGTVISLYLDHVNVTITNANGDVWTSENESGQLGKELCAKIWTEYVFEGKAGEEVNVTISNPHCFGNGTAVDDFLKKVCLYDEETDNAVFSGVGPMRFAMGILLLAFLFILLGVLLFTFLLHKKYDREIWLIWLLVFFGGMYFIFSWDQISVWNPLYTFNTMMLGASIMLYLLTVYVIVASGLDGFLRKTAIGATALLGAASLAAMLASLSPTVRFYDTYPYWTAFAVFESIVLVGCVCIAMTRKNSNREDDTIIRHKKSYLLFITVLLVFIADVTATLYGVWQGGMLSVCVLLLIMAISFVMIKRGLAKSIKDILAAKDMESEKRAMELKLQESQISIMLSQIQPHFLYNTLNSIYQLCETNPMRAKFMVNSFAEYLRNNLSSLEDPGLISFETELSHVNTYLDIEKVRFEDTLTVEYDIQCVDFFLPVLTVQPIVENAVKHGTSKKRGGGRVKISTREDEEYYIIKVFDSGCGFDPSKPKNDGKRHIGIENVRRRLANMCGGTLTIESEVGFGTLAMIRIPKGAKNENHSCGR